MWCADKLTWYVKGVWGGRDFKTWRRQLRLSLICGPPSANLWSHVIARDLLALPNPLFCASYLTLTLDSMLLVGSRAIGILDIVTHCYDAQICLPPCCHGVRVVFWRLDRRTSISGNPGAPPRDSSCPISWTGDGDLCLFSPCPRLSLRISRCLSLYSFSPGPLWGTHLNGIE